MNSQRLGQALVSAVFLFALGCGDDDGDGGGGSGVNSGISGSKVVEDLSDDEATKLCESVSNAGDSLGEISDDQGCIAGGAATTENKAACEEFVETCQMQPDDGDDDEPDEEPEEGSCDDAADVFEGCKATVAEVENCFNALIDQFHEIEDLTCDDAGSVTLEELQGLPGACDAVQEKCPSAFSGGAMDMGG